MPSINTLKAQHGPCHMLGMLGCAQTRHPSCSLSVLPPLSLILRRSSLILRRLSPTRPHPPSSPSSVACPALVARPRSLVLPPSPSHTHDMGAITSHMDMPRPCVCHSPIFAPLTDNHTSQLSMLMHCSSTTRTCHPHHTCHPLPAQTIDLCLPSLLSLNFTYSPVGEPNSEPISPPSPLQLQPDYYHHHARCFYCLGVSNAMPAPMPALTPLLSTDTTP